MSLIYDEMKGKKVLILGFGREGKSTYNFIRKELSDIEIGIADKNEDIKNDELIKDDTKLKFHLGEDYLNSIKDYDMVIKSPGIVLDDLSQVDKITSQTNIFLKYYNKIIIGVTATKGKTTTVTLLTQIIKAAGLDVILVGNVGIPAFDQIENIKKDTLIVYELSSFQLEYIPNSPHIAIMLNMYQDHLEIHKTFENYVKAKSNIVRYQGEDDIFVYNADNEVVSNIANDKNLRSKTWNISQKTNIGVNTYIEDEYIMYNGEKVYDLRNPRNLIGDHNKYNMMAVITVCKILNIDNDIITENINKYEPKPHRMEYVGTYGGIRFYNDSMATIPEPTMEAIKALKDVDTLIVGGYDKCTGYTELVEFLITSNVSNILCMYITGKKIYDMLMDKAESKNKNVMLVEGLEEAVKVSKKATAKGKICLMSPASASFGAFRNYMERGDIFRELVKG